MLKSLAVRHKMPIFAVDMMLDTAFCRVRSNFVFLFLRTFECKDIEKVLNDQELCRFINIF